MGIGTVTCKCSLNDYKPVDFEPSTCKRLEDAGVTIITGRQDNNLLDGVDRIIISPALPYLFQSYKRLCIVRLM